MNLRMKRPSPAFVVAMVALFVALGGTAGAVVTAAVPLAKRALVADNAKKLGGQTAPQIAAQGAKAAVTLSPPGAREASTAVGLVSTKTQAAQLGAGGAQLFKVACDTGQKVLSGGYVADNAADHRRRKCPGVRHNVGYRAVEPRRLSPGERESVRHLHEVGQGQHDRRRALRPARRRSFYVAASSAVGSPSEYRQVIAAKTIAIRDLDHDGSEQGLERFLSRFAHGRRGNRNASTVKRRRRK